MGPKEYLLLIPVKAEMSQSDKGVLIMHVAKFTLDAFARMMS